MAPSIGGDVDPACGAAFVVRAAFDSAPAGPVTVRFPFRGPHVPAALVAVRLQRAPPYSVLIRGVVLRERCYFPKPALRPLVGHLSAERN